MATAPAKLKQDPLRQVLLDCRSALIGVGLFSLIMNVLLLTGPFYMLQIYDRVLPGQSIPTLLVLSILVAGLMLVHGALDYVRSRLMLRIGSLFDLKLAHPAFDLATRQQPGVGGDPARDLRSVRHFLMGPAAVGLFDIPWFPVYIAVVFALHPVLGWMAIASSIALVALAVLNASASQAPVREAMTREANEDAFINVCRYNSETVGVLGMRRELGRIWEVEHAQLLSANQTGGDRSALYSSLSRTLRLLLQSAVLGVGAVLVVESTLSAGALVAASITFARALAPVDTAIVQWRGVVTARQAWLRLTTHFAGTTHIHERVTLGRPHQTLTVEDMTISTPSGGSIIVKSASLQLQAGDGLGIIGNSGSGKSTLVRGLLGAWPMVKGEVRLDGATLSQWREDELGAHIGYLPQDIHLFNGTVAQNIARFRQDSTSEAVIAAAKIAGVHELILSLPDGYETLMGPAGVVLSAGQCQRVAVARAVYGQPFLVVLDEPNSHADAEGEFSLINAMRTLRAAGSIVIVVAHRRGAIAEMNKLLLMNAGQVELFSDKNTVLSQIASKSTVNHGGLRAVAV